MTGEARTLDGKRRSWQAIVKSTRGPGLRAARRELAAYRRGIADASSTSGLRAPALLAWSDENDHVELWLEAVRDEYDGAWPIARYAVAARHIAAWDGRMTGFDVPASFDSEDAWAERHGQPDRVQEALSALDVLRTSPAATDVMERLHDPDFRETRALIEATPARIGRVRAFPQTLLHHDLVRSNLFALNDQTTAAIDWENVGRGPFGVDLAPLVVGSVRRGEASADDLPEIERLALAAYVDALRAAGLDRGSGVIASYRLAVALRWHVVLGTIRSSLDPAGPAIRGSRSDESRTEALRHLVGVSRHILDIAALAGG